MIPPLKRGNRLDFQDPFHEYLRVMTSTRHSTLAPDIANKLLKAILLGELKPGKRIYQAKMAQRLDVSHGTFREALQVLAASGVVTRMRRATVVAQHTRENAAALLAVRGSLEPIAAAAALEKLTPEDIRKLEFHLEKMDQTILARDWSSFLRLDLAFHKFIWQRSKVRTLSRLFKPEAVRRYEQRPKENNNPLYEDQAVIPDWQCLGSL